MIAPDTLQCSASMLEADGIQNILKKILHPDQGWKHDFHSKIFCPRNPLDIDFQPVLKKSKS